MHKIKKLLLTVAVVATSLLMGCANIQQNQKVATLCKVAAYDGTYLYVKAHPESRVHFQTAVEELKALEAAETVDAVTLLAIVQRFPVKELHSEAATLVVGNATLILSDYTTSVPVEQIENLKPIVKAIREGVELGLGPTPSPSASRRLRQEQVEASLLSPVYRGGGL